MVVKIHLEIFFLGEKECQLTVYCSSNYHSTAHPAQMCILCVKIYRLNLSERIAFVPLFSISAWIIFFFIHIKSLFANQLVKCVLVFLEAEDFSRGRGSLLSFISGFMECISEMDFLWQDLIPHVVGTFISQALSNFHLAHFPLHLDTRTWREFWIA